MILNIIRILFRSSSLRSANVKQSRITMVLLSYCRNLNPNCYLVMMFPDIRFLLSKVHTSTLCSRFQHTRSGWEFVADRMERVGSCSLPSSRFDSPTQPFQSISIDRRVCDGVARISTSWIVAESNARWSPVPRRTTPWCYAVVQ